MAELQLPARLARVFLAQWAARERKAGRGRGGARGGSGSVLSPRAVRAVGSTSLPDAVVVPHFARQFRRTRSAPGLSEPLTWWG